MGDPKKLKKKYQTQMHPWIREAIETGKKLKQEYGLQSTKEILIANSFLKKYKTIAKQLTVHKNVQKEKEKQQVIGKLHRLGLLPANAELYQILTLELTNILERRLQSLVYRKNLARTMLQARQFIIHRHIMINNKEVTSPSYLVSVEEESQVAFKPKSTLASPDHPERAPIQKISDSKSTTNETEPANQKLVLTTEEN